MALENQRVVVVGGSSGMGRGIARQAAAAGAAVVIASRSREHLETGQAATGPAVDAATLDVRDEEAVARAALMLMQNGFITGAVIDVDGGHVISG